MVVYSVIRPLYRAHWSEGEIVGLILLISSDLSHCVYWNLSTELNFRRDGVNYTSA